MSQKDTQTSPPVRRVRGWRLALEIPVIAAAVAGLTLGWNSFPEDGRGALAAAFLFVIALVIVARTLPSPAGWLAIVAGTPVAVSWIGMLPLGSAPWLGTLASFCQLAVVFGLFAAVTAFIVSLVLVAAGEGAREPIWFWAAPLLAMIGVIALRVSGNLERFGAAGAAERGAPLVAAIREFRQDHAAPPNELADLLPDYLEQIPSTGLSAAPRFRYARPSGRDGGTRDWYLSVPLGGGMPFDFRRISYPSDGQQPRESVPLGDGWFYHYD